MTCSDRDKDTIQQLNSEKMTGWIHGQRWSQELNSTALVASHLGQVRKIDSIPACQPKGCGLLDRRRVKDRPTGRPTVALAWRLERHAHSARDPSARSFLPRSRMSTARGGEKWAKAICTSQPWRDPGGIRGRTTNDERRTTNASRCV